MNQEKLRSEETPSKANGYRSSQKQASGTELPQKRVRQFNNGTIKRKFFEDWLDHGRQTHANDSDCDNSQNFMVKGMATVHGSQHFPPQDGANEVNQTQGSQKGHSIGYYHGKNASEYNGKLQLTFR